MGTIHDVKWHSSSFTGATQITNVAGKLVDMLDAVLVNGYNSNDVTSIVVASGVATVTTSLSHGFTDYSVIAIDGVTDKTALNGSWKSTVTSANTFTFPTAESDGTAAGTITAKTAPLGWTKPFSGTQKAMYKAAGGGQRCLRVIHTNQQVAFARGFEAATSIDTGTNPFPTVAQVASEGVYWITNHPNNANVAEWMLFGDDRFFVLMLNGHKGTYSDTMWGMYMFGDINTYGPADTYNCVLNGGINWTSYFHSLYGTPCSLGRLSDYSPASTDNFIGSYLARSYTGGAGPVRWAAVGNPLGLGFGNGLLMYPNPTDDSVPLQFPLIVAEEGYTALRGELPGIAQPLQKLGGLHGSVFTMTIGPLAGRRVMICKIHTTNINAAVSSAAAFDITGPWR